MGQLFKAVMVSVCASSAAGCATTAPLQPQDHVQFNADIKTLGKACFHKATPAEACEAQREAEMYYRWAVEVNDVHRSKMGNELKLAARCAANCLPQLSKE
jgi:hypothetical protein